MTDTFTPHVDLGQLPALMKAVEAVHHQQGWPKQPNPVMYVAYDHTDVVVAGQIEECMANVGEPIRSGRYTACPMISTRAFFDAYVSRQLQPDDAVGRFVLNFCFSSLEELADPEEMEHAEAYRSMMRQPGIIGFLYICETRSLTREQAQQAKKIIDSGQRFTGGSPCRTGVMVDVLGRAHCIRRAPGEQPHVSTEIRHSGRLAVYLRMMTDAVRGQLPEPDKIEERYLSDMHLSQALIEDAAERTDHPGPA